MRVIFYTEETSEDRRQQRAAHKAMKREEGIPRERDLAYELDARRQMTDSWFYDDEDHW